MFSNIYTPGEPFLVVAVPKRDSEPIHTVTGLRGVEARKYFEDFVRLRINNHWVKVPNPKEGSETSSFRPTLKSRVLKVDKVKVQSLNEKLYKIPKKKIIETVTREQTPPTLIGEDPLVVVIAEEPVLEEPVSEEPISEEPIFDPQPESFLRKMNMYPLLRR